MGLVAMAATTSTHAATSLSVATAPGSLRKMDTRGRVRTSKERRQAIFAEFDRSGVSGAQFAQLTGLRYSTFAGVSRPRKAKAGSPVATPTVTPARRAPRRWVEATMDPPAPSQGLLVQLPGGVQLELTAPAQVPLVVALGQGLQPQAARC